MPLAINPVLAFLLAGGAAAYFFHRQFYFGWVGLVVYGCIFGLAGVEASRMYPAYYEFGQVRQVLGAITQRAGFDAMSATDIRSVFDTEASKAGISSIAGKDLDVQQGARGPAVRVRYEVVVPVYGNMQFIMEFEYSGTPRSTEPGV